MITHIAVLGAGTMGFSIAKLFAEHHYSVALYEPFSLQAAKEKISHETLSIHLVSELKEAISNADLVIECAPETMEIKQPLYRQLTALLKQDAIVASNTSTFSLQQLADGLPYADRIVIAHFFNPAHLIPLVELVGLANTRPGILEELAELLRQMGKAPVVLSKDIPGFIANRLQAALLREADFLLENGIAGAEEIDSVVRNGLGLRWALRGPFQIADLGGLDIWSKVTGHLFPALSNGTEPPASMINHIARGELGVKSGGGYYTYSQQEQSERQMKKELQQLLAYMKHKEENDNGI